MGNGGRYPLTRRLPVRRFGVCDNPFQKTIHGLSNRGYVGREFIFRRHQYRGGGATRSVPSSQRPRLN